MHGWKRDPYRACNLYRAAAWGCTEEEEPTRVGIPNGFPEAMIMSANIGISMLKGSLGYDNSPESQAVPFQEWLEEGLRTEKGLDVLSQVFHWVGHALRLHGWVTLLTLMLAEAVKDRI